MNSYLRYGKRITSVINTFDQQLQNGDIAASDPIPDDTSCSALHTIVSQATRDLSPKLRETNGTSTKFGLTTIGSDLWTQVQGDQALDKACRARDITQFSDALTSVGVRLQTLQTDCAADNLKC